MHTSYPPLKRKRCERVRHHLGGRDANKAVHLGWMALLSL